MKTTKIHGVRAAQIEEFPDYYVLEDGRVWSTKVYHGTDGRFLVQSNDINGYQLVNLYGKNSDGKIHKSQKVHRLVGMYFVEGYSNELTVNHKDFNITNNHYTNLEWMTAVENNKDSWAKRPRNIAFGERCGNSIHKESTIIAMKKMYFSECCSQREVARRFNVSYKTFNDILRKKSWKHLD